VIFLALGVGARLGVWKKWYWGTKGAIYGYLPMGLVFLLYGFDSKATARLGSLHIAYQALMVLLGLCGLWWTFRPPAFVKPAWVRWVEAYPQNLYDAMAKAVKQGEAWEAHMASPESVDAWVKSLRPKNRKKAEN
jgi:hypothetical protein